jgi:hypothetical protein
MTSTSATLTDYPSPARDREVIRVDFASEKQGIAAALRRAFEGAPNDHSDCDFESLLGELN